MAKNLVISTVSDSSLHRHWIQSKDYDSYLIYYGEKEGYEGQSTYYKRKKGYKFHLIKDAIEEMADIYKYDYVWLPDDDIAATSEEVCALFLYMKEYQLEIAQPSIMGYYGVDLTLHQKGSKIRFTNWVEIMCPCFSLNALLECKKTFKENNTGWAIEGIWSRLLGHPTNKIAIIDDIIVYHTRPALSGDTYSGRNDPLAFAMQEGDEIFAKWNLIQDRKLNMEKGTAILSEVFGAVLYSQEFKEMEAGLDRSQRLWPNNAIIIDLLKELRCS